MLTMTATDFGESHHTASSEPFFYDQSYRLVKHTSPIVVDNDGRCVIADEVGQRDSKTERPLRWKCTAECKLPSSNEVQCIVAVKALFEEPVHKLREALNRIDECTEHGHYTCMLSINTPKPYYELAGHPFHVPQWIPTVKLASEFYEQLRPIFPCYAGFSFAV